MMNWLTGKTTSVWFGLALAILIVIAVVAHETARQFIDTSQSVAHSYQVLTKLEVTISMLKDSESGMRGYVLTGEERFLEPYNNAIDIIGQERNELRDLLQGRRAQQQRLDTLEFLFQRKLSFTEQTIDLRKVGGFKAAQQRVLAGVGQSLMDEIRVVVAEMQREEQQLLSGQVLKADNSAQRAMAIVLFGGLLAMTLVTLATAVTKRNDSMRRLAQEELHASEERFRAVAETANETIIFADSQGNIAYCNNAAERTFGYAASEMVGKPLILLMPERFHDAHSQGFARFLSTGESRVVGKTVELTGRRRDGADFPLELSLSSWKKAGEIHFIGIIRDISERKRAEEERDRFFTLSLDLLCIAGFDGYFKRLNPAWERTLGFTTAELLAEPYMTFIHPDDREATAAEANKVHAGAEAISFENRYRCNNGSYKWLSWTAKPFPEQGLIYAVAHDITDRKRQETRLAQLATIVESSDDAIISTTLDGIVTSWNKGAQRIYGYSGDEATGRPISFLIPLEHVNEEPKILERIKRGERVEHYETVRVRKDGKLIDVSLSISPIKDASGKVIGASKIARDITGRKRLEEQLRRKNEELEKQNQRVQEANRLKSEFLANMSHELRTPLNSIIGFTELIHDGKVGPLNANQKEYMGDILTSSRHLLQLINDVLDLSKVESGKMEFHPEPVDLNQIVGEVRDILRSIAGSKRIAIAAEVAPALGQVIIDPAKLKQVLYNYLSNALKFTPDEGRVTVRAKPEGTDHFRLEVEDTGIGIRQEDLGRLFVEFQQLDASAAKKYPGTGLGLALTKRLVQAQGGTVGVRSTVGKGSVFFVVLPRLNRAGAQPAPERGPTPHPGAPKVLIVEDEAQDRIWLAQTIGAAGYHVETASTGVQAVAKCREQAFDMIMLDLLLPDMNGREVLKMVQREGQNRHTPVIVVSLVSEKGVVAGYHVHDIFQKPVEEKELLASLKKAEIVLSGSTRVLVVDDDQSFLTLAKNTIQNLGYQPVCVENPLKALKMIAQDPPAAVVLDLMMPETDGFEFLNSLRKNPAGRRIPVIVCTLKDLTESERAKLRSSVQGVVFKTDGLAALVREIQTWLPPAADPADAR